MYLLSRIDSFQTLGDDEFGEKGVNLPRKAIQKSPFLAAPGKFNGDTLVLRIHISLKTSLKGGANHENRVVLEGIDIYHWSGVPISRFKPRRR